MLMWLLKIQRKCKILTFVLLDALLFKIMRVKKGELDSEKNELPFWWGYIKREKETDLRAIFPHLQKRNSIFCPTPFLSLRWWEDGRVDMVGGGGGSC